MLTSLPGTGGDGEPRRRAGDAHGLRIPAIGRGRGFAATPVGASCGGDVADANGLQGREYKRVDYDGAGNALAVETTR